ncbi:Deoxycytidylate deaminase [Madurella mycetomatis]|uniref:Deoxycytidylate deaminase n=1 Tax=Madurella mycetomatis TaxID=100816 RepID=A0A175W711_9PEZI|nr:Deoxycytidylate deaminase [Madurella mycetomatis]
MFIGICGSICAGKRTIARYLVGHHGFTQLYLESRSRDTTENAVEGPASNDSSPSNRHQVFSTPGELVNFITKRWQGRWVTTDIPDEDVLDMYMRRPFFLLISVDAPLTVRWQRFQARQNHQRTLAAAAKSITTGSETPPTHTLDASTNINNTVTTLDSFVALSDAQLYDPLAGLNPLMSRATVRLLNTSSDLAHLYANLGKLDLLNPDRLRPSWDSYFMALASLAAQRSNCMKRRVGCVVVRDKRVVSTGYNGTPRGMLNCGEGGCGRCNAAQGSGHGLATCLCIHAEENALLEAGRERVREGAVLYCDTCPCLTCSIKIVQVGISEVVYSQGYSMDGETAAVFREAGVRLRQFVPPANGLIHLEKPELYR